MTNSKALERHGVSALKTSFMPSWLGVNAFGKKSGQWHSSAVTFISCSTEPQSLNAFTESEDSLSTLIKSLVDPSLQLIESAWVNSGATISELPSQIEKSK